MFGLIVFHCFKCHVPVEADVSPASVPQLVSSSVSYREAVFLYTTLFLSLLLLLSEEIITMCCTWGPGPNYSAYVGSVLKSK